jgi:hypothetical protein
VTGKIEGSRSGCPFLLRHGPSRKSSASTHSVGEIWSAHIREHPIERPLKKPQEFKHIREDIP